MLVRREARVRPRFLIRRCSLLANSSVVEGAEKRSASLGPMGWVLVSGHADEADEVSRVTSRGQDTFPVHREVERHQVDALGVLIDGLQRDEVEHRSHSEKHLRVTLIQEPSRGVPFAAFHVHTLHEDTVGRSGGILISLDLVVEVHDIDGNLVLSGVVLASTCQEAVSEEELIDPEDSWDAIIEPAFEELNTALHVFDIAAQWFERVETLHLPKFRDDVHSHGRERSFKLGREKSFSSNGFLEFHK